MRWELTSSRKISAYKSEVFLNGELSLDLLYFKTISLKTELLLSKMLNLSQKLQ